MILLDIGFMRPERLWALLVVPVLLGVYLTWTVIKHTKVKADRSALEVLFPKRKAWKRHVSVIAAIATLASLGLAWAMPNGYINVPKDRATIFLVMDVSLSMQATDVAPSRLLASEEAAKEFVGELPAGFNVALISFAREATLLVPPTQDRSQVDTAIGNLQLAQSTAIGNGIIAALNAVALIPADADNPLDPNSVAIVLISDGESNWGVDSHQAALQAKQQQIPIFTISYGTANGYIINGGKREPVPVNKEELRDVANTSGGKAYQADSLNQLREVYQGISQSVGYVQEKAEITEKFVGVAAVFGVIALLGVMSLAARWP